MNPLWGPAHHLEGGEILILVLYHISLWLKKLNAFLMAENSIFQKSSKISKILKFYSLREILTFDTSKIAN